MSIYPPHVNTEDLPKAKPPAKVGDLTESGARIVHVERETHTGARGCRVTHTRLYAIPADEPVKEE